MTIFTEDIFLKQKIFKEFDKDKNGSFNSYELRDALNSTGAYV